MSDDQYLRDPYVKLAKIQNYRCRSAFKLKDIDSDFGLIEPGMAVLDIGAAPGGWSQVIAEKLAIVTGYYLVVICRVE